MKSKLKYAIIMLIVVIIVALCGSYTKYDASQMPLIVFQFSFTDSTCNYPDTSSMWTIDNEGKIFYFNSTRCFEYEEDNDIQTFYEKLKQEEYARYVGSVDQQVLKEKYAYLHEILRDNHYEKDVSGYEDTSGREGEITITSCEYKGMEKWRGYAITSKGNAEMIMLHEEGDVYYTSEDERMKELADWLDEILQEDIKENKLRCQQLKSEENYKKWLEYKELNQKE